MEWDRGGGGGGGESLVIRQDKTRQDNALFRVLYSPMYIDFIPNLLIACGATERGGGQKCEREKERGRLL